MAEHLTGLHSVHYRMVTPVVRVLYLPLGYESTNQLCLLSARLVFGWSALCIDMQLQLHTPLFAGCVRWLTNGDMLKSVAFQSLDEAML
jgi:hypothetical protein